jgi:hypothetical protein
MRASIEGRKNNKIVIARGPKTAMTRVESRTISFRSPLARAVTGVFIMQDA